MIESYSNYEWFLKKDLKEYSGKWLAIIDQRVVTSGANVEEVIRKTNQKYPKRKPFITKVKDKLSIL